MILERLILPSTKFLSSLGPAKRERQPEGNHFFKLIFFRSFFSFLVSFLLIYKMCRKPPQKGSKEPRVPLGLGLS